MKTLIIILFLPLQVVAQDIVGMWTGFIQTTEKKLPYELAISDSGGRLSGFSYTTFVVNGKELVTVKAISIQNEQGSIVIADEDVVFDNFTNKSARKIKQTNYLTLQSTDSVTTLAGTFSTKETRGIRAAEGMISLVKKSNAEETKLVPKLEELKLSTSLSFTPTTPPKKAEPVEPVVEVVVDEPAPERLLETVVIKSALKAKAKDLRVALKPKPKGSGNATALLKPVLPAKPKPVEQEVAIVEEKIKPVAKPKEVAKAPVTTAKPAPPKPKEQPVVVKPAAPVVVTPPPPVKKEVVVAKPAPPYDPTVMVPAGSAVDLGKRSIETIQTVLFKNDSLVLNLYDNGDVDGDTVSVVLNGRVIIGKQGLTTRAITKTIYMTPELGDSLQLIMYAENLGSLPPNTGLLILMDGNDRYEIRFAGDLQKNAAINLRRRRL